MPWAGAMKKAGELAEESTLYTFAANQLRYIDSNGAELIVDEVTAGLRLTGTGKPHRRLAILSLLNACFEAFHNEPEEEAEVGVLWPTSTAEEPPSRYKQKLFSPAAKKKAAENLEAYGYIKFRRGGKDPSSFVPGVISIVKPTEKLRAVYDEVIDSPFNVVSPFEDCRELVVLKDAAKRLVDYADNDFTRSVRELLNRVNRINHSHQWCYEHRNGEIVDIQPSSLTLSRQFRESSFKVYGRFHCEAQGLRKSERWSITIDEQDTVELDFIAMMPTLAYAWAGQNSAELDAWVYKGDPYVLDGYKRELVKKAFLTCLNTKSRSEAAKSLLSEEVFGDSKETAYFIDSLIAKHSRIKHIFFREAWMQLNFEESQIMSFVLDVCAGFKKPVLAMHDGVVCREVDKGMIANIMRNAFEQRLGVIPEIAMVKDNSGRKELA